MNVYCLTNTHSNIAMVTIGDLCIVIITLNLHTLASTLGIQQQACRLGGVTDRYHCFSCLNATLRVELSSYIA